MPTTTPRRPQKSAAPRRTRRPAARPCPAAKPRIDVSVPMDTFTFYTEGTEKFMALSIKEREHIMLEGQIEMKRAMNGMTLDKYLAERRIERRREIERGD